MDDRVARYIEVVAASSAVARSASQVCTDLYIAAYYCRHPCLVQKGSVVWRWMEAAGLLLAEPDYELAEAFGFAHALLLMEEAV